LSILYAFLIAAFCLLFPSVCLENEIRKRTKRKETKKRKGKIKQKEKKKTNVGLMN